MWAPPCHIPQDRSQDLDPPMITFIVQILYFSCVVSFKKFYVRGVIFLCCQCNLFIFYVLNDIVKPKLEGIFLSDFYVKMSEIGEALLYESKLNDVSCIFLHCLYSNQCIFISINQLLYSVTKEFSCQ